MRVFTYVITHDGGSAPNFDAPKATLAICKPKIRLTAEPGDLVLAFTGKTLGPEPHAVRWAGVVSEKLTFHDYWCDSRFMQKKPEKSATPDNIYKPAKSEMQQVPNSSHEPAQSNKDLGGRYVLIFDRTWYFGPADPILPAAFGLRLVSGRRAHRAVEYSDKELHRLCKWLDAASSQIDPGNQTPPSPGGLTQCR